MIKDIISYFVDRVEILRTICKMNKQDFYFDLPSELIAQYPLKNRSDSRLLCYNRQLHQHGHYSFRSLPDFLEAGDLLVFNNSKVIPARLYGHKESGGKVEFLVERILTTNSFLAHIKASKALKPNTAIRLNDEWTVTILNKIEDLLHCTCNGDVSNMLNEVGHIPLPPYISRNDETLDISRYQTVYAKHDGSVAAPTAGLHFDDELLSQLRARNINLDYATLHVGAGTFRPVRSDNIADHKMHQEYFEVSQSLCDIIHATKAQGKRVIAVGTTALRSLESAATEIGIVPCSRETDIFIYPGYQFKICDGLITNFHLPESTLLMLVSAFIGYDTAMNIYEIAIKNGYRFFSYGDACLFL